MSYLNFNEPKVRHLSLVGGTLNHMSAPENNSRQQYASKKAELENVLSIFSEMSEFIENGRDFSPEFMGNIVNYSRCLEDNIRMNEIVISNRRAGSILPYEPASPLMAAAIAVASGWTESEASSRPAPVLGEQGFTSQLEKANDMFISSLCSSVKSNETKFSLVLTNMPSHTRLAVDKALERSPSATAGIREPQISASPLSIQQ